MSTPTIQPRRRKHTAPSDQPQIILGPYQDELKTLLPSRQTALNKPSVSSVGTEYKGRVAEDISWSIGSGFKLDPNQEYPYPIDEAEDGELEYFGVLLNDENLYVVCYTYDEDNRPTPICDDNMKSLAKKGRGMTLGEATATDHNGVSLDKGCRPHPLMSYLARSKHTFSYGHLSDNYDDIAGGDFDKYYVIEYAPIRRAQPYKHLFFTIQNRGNETRLIHEAFVKRIAYTDKFDLVVNNNPLNPEEEEGKAKIGFS